MDMNFHKLFFACIQTETLNFNSFKQKIGTRYHLGCRNSEKESDFDSPKNF